MKRTLLYAACAAFMLPALTGCQSVETKGNDTYVNGKCVTCWKNPFDKSQANPSETQVAKQKSVGAKSCEDKGLTKHFRDGRWCSDITLPGATMSSWIDHVEDVDASVDVAYIRAKRLLQFLDADDPKHPYINKAKIDSIHSTYYSVNAMYGGPIKGLDWYAKYDLQLEKISSYKTRVRLKYRTYARDMNPLEFQEKLIKAIEG